MSTIQPNRDATLDLVRYKNLAEYMPVIGDTVVNVGWFRTKFGVISGINGNTISIIYSGTFFSLCNMLHSDMEKNTISMHISDITRSRPGAYSVTSVDPETGIQILYI